MKSTYIICYLILDIFLILFAALAPIWITPGWYWWTAFAILMLIGGSYGFSERLDKWQAEIVQQRLEQK